MTRADATAWVEAVATGEWPTHRVEAPDDAARALNPKGPRHYVTVAYVGSEDRGQELTALEGQSFEGETHNFTLVVSGLSLNPDTRGEGVRDAADRLAVGLLYGVSPKTDGLTHPKTVRVNRSPEGREGDLWTAGLEASLA